MTYLAGPTLHGRGSGTEDEHKAAEFIAGKLKAYGLDPAAGDGQYIQTGTIRSREVVGSPTLDFETKSKGGANFLILTHGKQIVMAGLSQAELTAPLRKIDLNDEKAAATNVAAGSALLIKLKAGTTMEEARGILEPYRSGKAAIVIVASSAYAQRMFEMLAKQPPQMPQLIGNQEPKPRACWCWRSRRLSTSCGRSRAKQQSR